MFSVAPSLFYRAKQIYEKHPEYRFRDYFSVGKTCEQVSFCATSWCCVAKAQRDLANWHSCEETSIFDKFNTTVGTLSDPPRVSCGLTYQLLPRISNFCFENDERMLKRVIYTMISDSAPREREIEYFSNVQLDIPYFLFFLPKRRD